MSDRVLGDIATKMLFENKRIRVWEMRLEPGEKSDVHLHDMDYLMIQISGEKMAADFEPDSPDTWGATGRLEGAVFPGNVLWATRGGIETAVNVGEKAFHEIVVEFKD